MNISRGESTIRKALWAIFIVVIAALFVIFELLWLHSTISRILTALPFLVLIVVALTIFLRLSENKHDDVRLRISEKESRTPEIWLHSRRLDTASGQLREHVLQELKNYIQHYPLALLCAGAELESLVKILLDNEFCTFRKVFYATDRQPRSREGSMLAYEGERHESGKLSFGICTVTIPVRHKIGSLEGPSIWRLQFRYSPSKHVTLVDVEEKTPEAFFVQVASKVKNSEQKEAFVFIHGYNVSFEDAARRTAQIAEDLKFEGAAIFYSWPSKAAVKAYVADETNIRWTVPHLKAFLVDLAEAIGISTIHLIGHSMGNRALADVLESWNQDTQAPNATFKHVVLTAPDIDAGTFKELAAAIRPTAHRLTMYSSEHDKALSLSRQFHGYPRAGERVLIVSGIDTIDASAVDTSFLGHSYPSENRSVLQDIYSLLTSNAPPDKRFGMTRKEGPEGIYYVFHP